MDEATLVGQILSAPLTKDIGLAAILTLVMVSIIRGWLTPSAIVKQLLAAKDVVIAAKEDTIKQLIDRVAIMTTRGDEYKATADKQMELIKQITDQNGDLISGFDTSNHYFRELTRITRGASSVAPQDGDDVLPGGGLDVGTR